MKVRHFIVATAGHVDHGKSALVQALTQTDPDRLPEEKARGITIELGFAELVLPGRKDPETELRLGVIDVPGHEDFVKNMVAGVGCVNLGLIVVAADDGWMPQTEEHFQILSDLGVERVVIVLNKIDLVADDDEAFLVEVIRDELKETAYAEIPIIPTSTVTGRGIEELKATLTEALEAAPDAADVGQPRLSVDRVFSVKGHGTVVTGTLADGQFEVGQSVVIQPQGLSSRIRALQSFGQSVDRVGPGTRVAVNLGSVGVRASGAPASEGVGRGDVVTVPKVALSTNVVDCLIAKSARQLAGNTPAARVLKQGARVRLHHGSSHVAGRVFFVGRDGLAPGEQAPAELRLEQEVMVLSGDRFVLRDWSEVYTMAGGVVLEPRATTHRFRTAPQQAFLSAFPGLAFDVATWLRARMARDKVDRVPGGFSESRFGLAAVEAALERLGSEEGLVRRGDTVVEGAFWQEQKTLAEKRVRQFHRDHPELGGLPVALLRADLDERWAKGGGLDPLLEALSETGFVVNAALIRASDHTISLPADLAGPVGQLRRVLGEKEIDPPARKQLAGSETDERALRFLLDTGEAVEIGAELVMLATGRERLVGAVKAFLEAHGSASVSELRSHTGVSRRIMLPVLEQLDSSGVTVRDGDQRTLGAKA